MFRRAACPYPVAEVALRGLNPEALYEVVSDLSGPLGVLTGKQLATALPIHLPEKRCSDLIIYRRK